jgi:hypothetical protein
MSFYDLRDRLQRAEDALKSHAKASSGNERSRLEGKAQGVYLARTYVEEMLRAEARL